MPARQAKRLRPWFPPRTFSCSVKATRRRPDRPLRRLPPCSAARGDDTMKQSKANGAKSHQEMISDAYLRNAWYVAAWSDRVGDGQLVPRTIMDEPIVLYRKADGAVAAIGDRCAHRFAPLRMGKIVGGDRIQCPYHGLEYDGSGACVRNPHGTKNIPPRARVKSYPVIEKHKAVWVWMGDAPAEESKIPDFGLLHNGQ